MNTLNSMTAQSTHEQEKPRLFNVKAAISWPCWLKHDWLPWDPPEPCGFGLYQNRMCAKCGKLQQREAGVVTHGKYNP